MNNPDTLTANLENQITENRITKIANMRDHLICSFIGLPPNFNDKWHKIYLLSNSYGRFVNCHITKIVAFLSTQF